MNCLLRESWKLAFISTDGLLPANKWLEADHLSKETTANGKLTGLSTRFMYDWVLESHVDIRVDQGFLLNMAGNHSSRYWNGGTRSKLTLVQGDRYVKVHQGTSLI